MGVWKPREELHVAEVRPQHSGGRLTTAAAIILRANPRPERRALKAFLMQTDGGLR